MKGAINWKQDQIKVRCTSTTEIVEASVLDDYAVHKTLAKPNYWTITHIPSGLSVASVISTKKKAMAVAQELLKKKIIYKRKGNRYFRKGQPLDPPQEFKDAVVEVLKKHNAI